MTEDAFSPAGFHPPTSLVTEQFRLEPLGPQHNEADHAAWMSSIEHIRSTPGYPDGKLAATRRHDARGEPGRPPPARGRLRAHGP